jgi:hypothetical protein
MTNGNEFTTISPLEQPLVFISHDSRDAILAEAFSKLLRDVSSGALKSFRSSDRTGTGGIEFGAEWYDRLTTNLKTASDVVCLLTERSLNRPWILYEAGVAKGGFNASVYGIALGMPLCRVTTGPFYLFQNSDDNEDSLTTLALQLCHRIPLLDPDRDVVKDHVKTFKKTVDGVLAQFSEAPPEPPSDESGIAKFIEEMKLMIRNLLRDSKEPSFIDRHPRFSRWSPLIINAMAGDIQRRSDAPIGILIIASLFREEIPWLYEIGVEAYRAARSGNARETEESLRMFRDAAEFTARSHSLDELGLSSRVVDMLNELPIILGRHSRSFLPSGSKDTQLSEEEEPQGK